MGALDPDGLIQVVLKATWSLEEAAHLVRDVNPVTQSVVLSDVSSHPVSLTYFWLKKEYLKGDLMRVSGNEENPRFSPGTLMRRLETKDQFVSPIVRKLYDAAHGHRGPKSV